MKIQDIQKALVSVEDGTPIEVSFHISQHLAHWLIRHANQPPNVPVDDQIKLILQAVHDGDPYGILAGYEGN